MPCDRTTTGERRRHGQIGHGTCVVTLHLDRPPDSISMGRLNLLDDRYPAEIGGRGDGGAIHEPDDDVARNGSPKDISAADIVAEDRVLPVMARRSSCGDRAVDR